MRAQTLKNVAPAGLPEHLQIWPGALLKTCLCVLTSGPMKK